MWRECRAMGELGRKRKAGRVPGQATQGSFHEADSLPQPRVCPIIFILFQMAPLTWESSGHISNMTPCYGHLPPFQLLRH